MSDDIEVAAKMREAIDSIEEAYEYMLAYAAQGRQQETDGEGASQIRGFLEKFRSALDTISANLPGLLADGHNAFTTHFSTDIGVMAAVLDMLISHKNITSDMIDNTNGMIAVRSCLTNLFFIDQVMLPKR